jgi:hypothetical protein
MSKDIYSHRVLVRKPERETVLKDIGVFGRRILKMSLGKILLQIVVLYYVACGRHEADNGEEGAERSGP